MPADIAEETVMVPVSWCTTEAIEGQDIAEGCVGAVGAGSGGDPDSDLAGDVKSTEGGGLALEVAQTVQ